MRVWSTNTGNVVLTLDRNARAGALGRAVIGIDVSPDGSRIATAGAEGSVRIFDAETGEQLVVTRRLHCRSRRLCRVNRAVFSPDGSRLATTGWDGTVRILDAGTLRQLEVPHAHTPTGSGSYAVGWAPEGTRLFSMGADGTRIWDVRTGRKLLSLRATDSPGGAAAWSPDGRQVLTESGLGVEVWDASTGELLRTLETDAAVSELVFSRDGSRLAIGTVDERVYATRIWDWPAGVEILRLRDPARRVAFSPDGRLLAGVRQRLGLRVAPLVRVWALDPELLLEIARGRVTRSLTADECRRYLQRSCSERR